MAHIKRLLPEIYLLSKGNKMENMENTEIIIPKDKFVFVPLCGEKFSWEEFVQKGE